MQIRMCGASVMSLKKMSRLKGLLFLSFGVSTTCSFHLVFNTQIHGTVVQLYNIQSYRGSERRDPLRKNN